MTSAATTSLHLIVVPVLGLYEPSFLLTAQPYLVFVCTHSSVFSDGELLSTPLSLERGNVATSSLFLHSELKLF